jgi:hypothetical protein
MIILSILLFVILAHYIGQFICWVNDDKRLPLFVGGLWIVKVVLMFTIILGSAYFISELIK